MVDVEVCLRLAEDEVRDGLGWESVPLEMLYAAEPWRIFRWYMGQKHYSGSYWSSTQSDHVIYESRLELARLLYADSDRDVTAIVAQPFLLRADVDGALRRHIPDYLMATTTGPLVVDVKPRHRAARPEHAFTFTWTREAVASRGWRYEVWSEPPDAELANVRFLARYRRDWLFEPDLLDRGVPPAQVDREARRRERGGHQGLGPRVRHEPRGQSDPLAADRSRLAPRSTGRRTHLPRSRRGDWFLARNDQLPGPPT
ncbi:TnsA-like heteromeric transposase endonuclease subunit [Streptomyces sp. AJS327]|uniref:TnsA-like heteromeric transposase endonuclease subunit n=1 Tax=Streptomyces sp. AJS327 TaxID=2545265 RepID=UPI002155717E|nr:TnsA-like heteromeric transposase endonuclease subunit [Streptomyces sp. AJS327]